MGTLWQSIRSFVDRTSGRDKVAERGHANENVEVNSVDFSSEPVLSAQAAERGLSWKMNEANESNIMWLMHEGKDIAQLMGGEEDPVRRDIAMPPVNEFVFIEAHPLETPLMIEGRYKTLAEAAKVAEQWALTGGIEERQQFERDNPDPLTDAQEADVDAFNRDNQSSPGNPFGFFEKSAVDQLAEASQSYHDRLGATAGTVELSDGFLQGVADWSAQQDAQADRGLESGPDIDGGFER